MKIQRFYSKGPFRVTNQSNLVNNTFIQETNSGKLSQLLQFHTLLITRLLLVAVISVAFPVSKHLISAYKTPLGFSVN